MLAKGKVLVRIAAAFRGTPWPAPPIVYGFLLSQLHPSCMVCYVNNSAHEATENQPLADLLAALGQAQTRGLAVAINDTVVPRADWATHAVQPHDRILLIRATQGG
jgi:sulfur carrier protein